MGEASFPREVLAAAIARQGGVCAFCGQRLRTPWSAGEEEGFGTEVRPQALGGGLELENCVYLCQGDYITLRRGIAPFAVTEEEGEAAPSWRPLTPALFPFWHGLRPAAGAPPPGDDRDGS